jgi:hypothetical protein
MRGARFARGAKPRARRIFGNLVATSETRELAGLVEQWRVCEARNAAQLRRKWLRKWRWTVKALTTTNVASFHLVSNSGPTGQADEQLLAPPDFAIITNWGVLAEVIGTICSVARTCELKRGHEIVFVDLSKAVRLTHSRQTRVPCARQGGPRVRASRAGGRELRRGQLTPGSGYSFAARMNPDPSSMITPRDGFG